MRSVRFNGKHQFQVYPDTPLSCLHFCGLVGKFDFVGVNFRLLNFSTIEHKTFQDLWPFSTVYFVSTDEEPSIYTLVKLIIQGLRVEGRWKRWLTKGLYDPRLFILVRMFLYDHVIHVRSG